MKLDKGTVNIMKLDKETFKKDFKAKMLSLYAQNAENASPLQVYTVLGHLTKDYIARKWADTNNRYTRHEEKQVYYFSIEFLLGRLLGTNLLNLGILEKVKEALSEMGIEYTDAEEQEMDPGLGNGGLGRLAACFLDSMASLGVPGHGCGIRYKYGLFEQKFVDGYQIEMPENWLREGNVWEIRKPDKSVVVKFGGRIEMDEDENGNYKVKHLDYDPVLAVPYDTPVIGFNNETVNTLRLWNAETPHQDFDIVSISRGEYQRALDYKYSVEAISQVLYPDDSRFEGRLLRLKQEYFFVSAGVQSIIRRFKQMDKPLRDLPEKVAIHVNDTHPALCVPELMRILVDEEGMEWDEAWDITTKTVSYTNHTILAEALEKWPVEMFEHLLPRIYMIVNEINERFCKKLWAKYPGDWEKIRHMAIIADGYVKMAHLSIAGSHSVNGVAKLHTEILKKDELKNFYDYNPYKFNNKTNGITHRRWLMLANPRLTSFLNSTIGTNWQTMPLKLRDLRYYEDDPNVLEKIGEIKYQNKVDFSNCVNDKYGLKIDPSSLFDVQIKRLHAYKRQLLNALHILHLYHKILDNPSIDMAPRTFIFGAKAAPGYYFAKRVIKFINSMAEKINNDPIVKDRLKVLFLENYGVSVAQRIIPAADVSEQISTTTKEASGTGNMKLMMNGAITVATLDGANIEILNEVGQDNIFIFGLKEEEVFEYYRTGGYNSREIYNANPKVSRVVDDLINGFIPGTDVEGIQIYNSLIDYNDEFFVLRDFEEYVKAHEDIDTAFKDRKRWNKMSLNNTACSGEFSSDRTILEYASGIWNTRLSEH